MPADNDAQSAAVGKRARNVLSAVIVNTDIASKELLSALLPKFQAEQSAKAHPAREAKRLGTCPPATAMLAISRHGAKSLGRLRELGKARGMKSQTAVAEDVLAWFAQIPDAALGWCDAARPRTSGPQAPT